MKQRKWEKEQGPDQVGKTWFLTLDGKRAPGVLLSRGKTQTVDRFKCLTWLGGGECWQQTVRKQRPEAGSSGGHGHSPAGAAVFGECYSWQEVVQFQTQFESRADKCRSWKKEGGRMMARVLILAAGRMEFPSPEMTKTVGGIWMKAWLFGLRPQRVETMEGF